MNPSLCVLPLAALGTLLLSANAGAAPQSDASPVFDMRDLFSGVRIPKVIVTTNDTVLAFAKSGRLLRRSTDGGETWSPEAEVGHDASGSTVVDENTGDVLVVCSARGHLWRSPDDGLKWTRESITVKPNEAGQGSPETVRVGTTCSESGITLRHGKHKGRLLMPARVQPPQGSNAQEFWPYNYNTAIYSDDGGRTWQTAMPVQSGTGEGTLAELSNGHIYYNSRCHMAVDHRRRIAWSYDGGHMWTDWQVSEDLFEVGEPFYFKYGTKPSYGCNAGLVRVPLEATQGKDVLLFSTPDNPGKSRVRMTVWASFDGGKSWPVKRLVSEGHSAYSSLSADREGTIYLLFEGGNKKLYDTMVLARFNLDWLANGQDWRKRLGE